MPNSAGYFFFHAAKLGPDGIMAESSRLPLRVSSIDYVTAERLEGAGSRSSVDPMAGIAGQTAICAAECLTCDPNTLAIMCLS